MQLPHRVILRNKKQLKRHRKQTPAAYEWVSEEEGGTFIRSYHDAPAVRLGDALKQQLEKSGDAIGTLIFFQPFDELWYGCAFDHGVLVREHIGSVASLEALFAYELHHAEHLLVTKKKEEGQGSEPALPFFPDKQIQVPPIEPSDWQAFTLAPAASKSIQKRTQALGVIGLIGGVLAGAGWYFSSSDDVVVTQAPSVPPLTAKETFQASFMNQPLAYPLILNAVAMTLEAQTLPQGMTLSSISFDSVQNQLVGKVEKGDSRLKSRREWASKGEARQSQWVEQQEQLRSPILLTAPWHDVEVGEFLQEAIDALELFGVDVKAEPVTSHGEVRAHPFTLAMTGELGALALMAPILNAPFITITEFDMTLSGDAVSQLTLKITVQGVNHDR
ncbi:hypothetical protein AB4455_01020 [Vibrio sp. 10N.261.46.E12]|uniref:hypothetical protein n=1 Tax=unclassified Vibrio TaxID=2614977 RepID=UPI000C83E92D|nr:MULTISPECIES: hypothetical protein [unclassified Vibrio]PML89290.1 hypothetical protein BCT66_08060 [Vibrio sp. 10N.261.49.E11]PMN80290.1 hypothetical protein BCT25_01875 [Vibrio sp. 10N.261.45.A6]PMN82192.1 hypothetical protein BCT22_13885 [Vibrio sp. 10N.261.45.A1]